MILGVVPVIGASMRFGSDKALAQLDFPALLVLPIRFLALITAALCHAGPKRFVRVLTFGVDSAKLPNNLLALLAPPGGYLVDQRVSGLWPANALPDMTGSLSGNGRQSMRAFADVIGEREVQPATLCANINTPADLTTLEHRHGL